MWETGNRIAGTALVTGVATLLAGCGTIDQAPLVYVSTVKVGVNVSTVTAATPGFAINLGVDATVWNGQNARRGSPRQPGVSEVDDSIRECTFVESLRVLINGKNKDLCKPFLYRSSGGRFDVATTIAPFASIDSKSDFNIIASAISVT